ncbi:hypothetical protein K8R66_01900, partial [bacterium]|nr:hypothetical protein [bacterium]
TALIVGGGIYVWQRSNLKNMERRFQQKIVYLEKQIDQIQQNQVNSANRNDETSIQTADSSQQKISFTITNVPNFDIILSFDKPKCNELHSYSSDDRLKINEEYCNKYYDSGYIEKNNFILETEETNDQKYYVSNLKLLTSEYRFSEPIEKNILEEYVKKYDSYIQGNLEEYRISLFLNDTIDKDEVGRWYLTRNTMNMKKDELEYWNYCEAGCSIWPKDVIGDYILWVYNPDPATGAGNKCWRVSKNERGNYEKYEGDKQTKCDIMTSNNFLENIFFD